MSRPSAGVVAHRPASPASTLIAARRRGLVVAGRAAPRRCRKRRASTRRCPTTDSAVTVNGRGDFASLVVTVNQTRNLTNQAVSVTWTGGVAHRRRPGGSSENYLQVMQCWGDDDGTNPENPGPPPEQCVSGATTGAYGARGPRPPRRLPRRSAGSSRSTRGRTPRRPPAAAIPKNGFIWRPFRAVDGTVVNAQYDTDFNPSLGGGNYWQNPYFDIITTNELAGVERPRPNGTGSDLFEVNTGRRVVGPRLRAAVDPGGRTAPSTRRSAGWWSCLEATAEQENVGTPYEQRRRQVRGHDLAARPTTRGRTASPSRSSSTRSTPACALGADERRIVGTELVARGDQQLAAGSVRDRRPAALQLRDARRRHRPPADRRALGRVHRAWRSCPAPAAAGQIDPASPRSTRPIALSGVVIGFNVDRSPTPTAGAGGPGPQPASGSPSLNLTPRLVAKLLTQSYRSQVDIATVAGPYTWPATNPIDLANDPDFLQFNPEFEILQIAQRPQLQRPAGTRTELRRRRAGLGVDPRRSRGQGLARRRRPTRGG